MRWLPPFQWDRALDTDVFVEFLQQCVDFQHSKWDWTLEKVDAFGFLQQSVDFRNLEWGRILGTLDRFGFLEQFVDIHDPRFQVRSVSWLSRWVWDNSAMSWRGQFRLPSDRFLISPRKSSLAVVKSHVIQVVARIILLMIPLDKEKNGVMDITSVVRPWQKLKMKSYKLISNLSSNSPGSFWSHQTFFSLLLSLGFLPILLRAFTMDWGPFFHALKNVWSFYIVSVSGGILGRRLSNWSKVSGRRRHGLPWNVSCVSCVRCVRTMQQNWKIVRATLEKLICDAVGWCSDGIERVPEQKVLLGQIEWSHSLCVIRNPK